MISGAVTWRLALDLLPVRNRQVLNSWPVEVQQTRTELGTRCSRFTKPHPSPPLAGPATGTVTSLAESGSAKSLIAMIAATVIQVVAPRGPSGK